VDYGNSLRLKGEVIMTLQLPIFWVPYMLAGSCALVVSHQTLSPHPSAQSHAPAMTPTDAAYLGFALLFLLLAASMPWGLSWPWSG
jgi:hypothetical protein